MSEVDKYIKVGDEIECNCNGVLFRGIVSSVLPSNLVARETTREGIPYPGNLGGGSNNYSNPVNIFKILTPNKNSMSMIDTFKKVFASEPEKTLRKAGLWDEGNNRLSNDGQVIFTQWLLGKNFEAFKTDVLEPMIAELDSEKK